MTTVTFRRTIPLRKEVEVLVVGGGPAGIAAALAARRQGRDVCLIEGTSCLGGMGTAGLVPLFMPFSDGVNFLAGGIGQEIYERVWAAGLQGPLDRRDDPKKLLSIRAEALKRLYDDMIVASGVDLTFQTHLIAVEREGQRVNLAVCAAKSGIFALKAKVFVDCTGDGDLAAWAGAPYELGDAEGNMQPGTLCSLWADVDTHRVTHWGASAEALLPQALADGVFTQPDRHLPGMYAVDETIAGGNLGHTFGVDGTDERSVTQALLRGRKLLTEYERFYKEYVPGFERMKLVATGALLGIRESRRILGDYVLNLDDFQRRAIFEDEIGRYNYPVDLHASKPDPTHYAAFEQLFQNLRYGPGESYGIPYRILVPRELENVLVAGRCVSTDRYLQGSLRVMPGCFITGQAAGVAAALAVELGTDVRGVPIGTLQRRLKAMGAFLPHHG